MYIDIKIAVLPLVKAYLQHYFCVEPFELSQDNQYGIFLFNCLSHAKKYTRLKPEDRACCVIDINTNRYSEILTIRLTERAWKRQGSIISADKQTCFNRMVIMDMNDKFFLWVDTTTGGNQMTLKSSFLSFREKFNLSEENLTLKSMEKKYERYRFDLTA